MFIVARMWRGVAVSVPVTKQTVNNQVLSGFVEDLSYERCVGVLHVGLPALDVHIQDGVGSKIGL